jgi:hypothetical protein
MTGALTGEPRVTRMVETREALRRLDVSPSSSAMRDR